MYHGFAGGFEGGEVHYGVEFAAGHYGRQRVKIKDVAADEGGFGE